MTGSTLAAALVEDGRRILAELAPRERLGLVAVGWATVELGRAARELGDALGSALAEPFEPAPDDPWLGAYAEAGRLRDGLVIVLLEPNTEGRVAGSLVRFGEAVIAAYVTTMPGRPALVGRPLVGPAMGPLGPSRLVASGRRGPHLVLVEPTDDGRHAHDPAASRATIRP